MMRMLASSFLLILVASSVALAAGGHGAGHHALSIEETFKYWSHFLTFVVIFFLLVKKPFVSFWISRSNLIEEQATKGERSLAEAELRLKGAEAKYSVLDSELAAFRERAAMETENEYAATLSEATHKAEKIAEQASASINAEKLAVEHEIQEQFAAQVIESARKKISTSLGASEDKTIRDSVLKGLANF